MSPDALFVACTVCLGAADGPLLTAARVGVLVMVGVTVSVLTAFALFFRRLAKNGDSPRFENGDSPLYGPDKTGTAPFFGGWLGLPVQASAQAAQLDHITTLVHILMAVMFVGWSVYFVYVLLRFRRRRQPVADYHGARGHWSAWTEAGVAVVEVILLAAFSIPAWASRVSPAPTDALAVRVVAQQFSWTFHYAGPDGEFGRLDASLISPDNPAGLDRASPHAADDVVSVNEMHLPVGRPVLVQLSARDVIHSFGVPAMRVKQDAIPGVSVPVWFTPTLPGSFDIACSQLCGLGHYRMRAVITVESADRFITWLQSQR